MKTPLKKFFVLSAAILFITAAKAATVFPIATNPAVVNFGGGVAFDGTNYFFGFLSGTNIVSQRVSGTNGSLMGSQIAVGSNPGFPPAIAGAFGKTNYLMAWSDNSINSGVDMFGQFISKSGVKVGAKFNLLSSVGSHGFQYVQALASDGTNFLVVWADGYNSGTETSGDFYGQLVTPAGTLSGSEFLLSNQHQNGNSAAAVFGKTNYLVVWQSNNNDTGNANKTYGEFVSPSGAAGNPFQISQTDSTDQNPLAVAFDGTNYLAAWNWDSGSGSGSVDNWDIYGRLISQTGNLPGTELHLVTDSGNQVLPALAFDGANYLMAWGDGSFDGSGSNIRFQFFNRSGITTNSEFTVFTAQGTNNPLFTYNGLMFDGNRFVAAATLGTVSKDINGDVNGFPSGEVFGAFIPSSTALQVTTASLPDGTTTVPYSQTLTASGGQAPYTWTLVSNSLPAGLSLSSGGVISGTPTTAGTTNFIVQVKDNTNSIATQALSLTIDALETGVGFTITPAAISNTYSGPVTLTVTGLAAGETVTVQQFADANTNGVIDAGDFLLKQLNLTDGQASVFSGVTNFNVPNDMNPATGQITAPVYFGQEDFIGKYAFKLSSPTAHFAPITNFVAVTNLPFAQSFSGNVVNSGTNVPNALVLVLAPSSGDLKVVTGTMANNSGGYTVKMPPGTYLLMAAKSNFVADFSTAPYLTLAGSQNITTNLTLTNATQSISGQIVDANNSSTRLVTLSGAESTNNLFALYFCDTSGNFTARVSSGNWKIGGSSSDLNFYGYLGLQNSAKIDTSTGSVSGVSIAVPKATAIFYGSVKDNFGNPLLGVNILSQDNNGQYESDTASVQNGNYVAGALGGGQWRVQVDQDNPGFTNYIFSQPDFDQNGGTNISAGQAVLANFTAIIATNHISGNVKFSGTNVVGVGVYASVTISNVNFNVYADTDTNGNYSFIVANGGWNVGVNQQGGDDGLDNILGNGNYQPPSEQSVNITNDNGTANFTIQSCNGVQIITTSPLPDGQQGSYYDTQLQGSDCNNNFIWSLDDPSDFPSSLTFNSDGEIFGTPDTSGTYNFSVNVSDGNGHSADTNMSLTISPPSSPLEITTTYLPNATNTMFYSLTFQASGGTPPYGWYVPDYSASLPANLSLATNGVLSGTLSTTAQTYYFYVDVTDAVANVYEEQFALNVVNPPTPPLTITNVSLPNGNVGVAYSAQLGATGGLPPYNWQLAVGSASLPLGLSLNSNGLISGTPTTNKPSSFKFQVQDQNGTVTNKVLSITINSKPVLASQSWQTNRFQMRLTGAANQNYTLQSSTNLSSTNWTALFITNNAATNSFLLTDPNATNKQRFYRVLIGP